MNADEHELTKEDIREIKDELDRLSLEEGLKEYEEGKTISLDPLMSKIGYDNA